MKPQLEYLENRCQLSATLTLTGNVLSITTDNQTNFLVASTPAVGVTEIFDIVANKTTDFTGVSQIRFRAGQGNSTFYNNTVIPSTQQAGSGASTYILNGGTGNDTLVGSNNPASRNYLSDSKGNDTLTGVNGFTNIFAGSGNHAITTGVGFNAVYSILGMDKINASKGTGYLLVDAQSSVTANKNYQIITFFQPIFATIKNPVFLQRDVNGNLIGYLLPQVQTAVRYVINPGPNNTETVTYTDANGTQKVDVPNTVSWFAFFGGPGGSDIENNTKTNNVFYGGKGNDYLVGGYSISVLKGHSNQDWVQARGSVLNDISVGPGGASTLIGGGANNIFRNDASKITTTDFNVHRNDVVLGVPAYINGDFSPNQGKVALNQDYLRFWTDLQKPIF